MSKKKWWVSLLAGLLAGIILLSWVVSILPAVHAEKSSEEIREEITEMEKEQEKLQQEFDRLESQKKENLNDIKDLSEQKMLVEQQVSLLRAKINGINEQIAAYAILVAAKQEELEEMEKRLEELNRLYKARIRIMEEEGEVSYWAVLFKATSFSDFLDRVVIVSEIKSADERRLENLRQAALDVQSARESLLQEREHLNKAKEELEDSQAVLNAKVAEVDVLLQSLVTKDQEFSEMMKESEALQDQLMDEIAKKEDDFDAAKDREYQEWLKEQEAAKGKGNVVDGIKWIIPCDYARVSSAFGPRTHPITGEKEKQHDGVDLVGPYSGEIYGKEVYATRAGKVVTAAYQKNGAGYYVTISHGDGYQSIYMHMTHYIVSAGDYVQAGQVIGYVGNSGGSTGPHLHFGISYNGKWIDPMKFIYK